MLLSLIHVHSNKKYNNKSNIHLTLHCIVELALDCKTVIFFVNASNGPYSNKRSGASVKTVRENGENGFLPYSPCGRVRLTCFTLEDHTYGTLRLLKTSESDCFAV